MSELTKGFDEGRKEGFTAGYEAGMSEFSIMIREYCNKYKQDTTDHTTEYTYFSAGFSEGWKRACQEHTEWYNIYSPEKEHDINIHREGRDLGQKEVVEFILEVLGDLRGKKYAEIEEGENYSW